MYPERDTLKNKSVQYSTVHSKRALLKNVSKIFDPLGLVTPVTLLPEEIWEMKLDWDDELPREVVQRC